MRGVHIEPDPPAPPRQPVYVLDAWIRDLLAEARTERVGRLVQLREKLRAEVFGWDNAQLAQALAALNSAGRELSFLPLHQGWFARLRGRHRAAHAMFVASWQRMVDGVPPVKARVDELAAGHHDHSSGARRALVELEMERGQLNTDIDQAVGWLEDLCTQLAEARAAGNQDGGLATLAESAQLAAHELKRLQTASQMAHEIAVRGHSVFDRRTALLDQVRSAMKDFETQWTARLGRLVEDLRADRSAIPRVPPAIEAHDEFMKRLAACVDACAALQQEEELMARQLAMLQERLDDDGH